MGALRVCVDAIVVVTLFGLCFVSHTGANVIEITVSNYMNETQTPTMVKFFAPWCGHCSMMAPAYNSLGRRVAEYRGAKVGQLDCDRFPGLGQQFGIKGYPTLGLVHKGKLEELYHGPKDESAMFEWLKSRAPNMALLDTSFKKHDRCFNVALGNNGAHAEADGMAAGQGPFKAIDDRIFDMPFGGWSWGGNLEHAMFLVAFNKMYDITRIKFYTGVGFTGRKITSVRLLYCNRKGGAYFSGYDTASCWKPIPNVTAVNNIAHDGSVIFKVSKEGKQLINVNKIGVQEFELATPPLRASGVSFQVMETDDPGNDAILTEIQVYTEPPCTWLDGCSTNERIFLEEEEAKRQEELKLLIKEIKTERKIEKQKIAVVQDRITELTKAADELLAQAETQFKVSNMKGEYGAFGLLEKARTNFEAAGVLEGRQKQLDDLEVKYRRALEAEEARKRGEEEAMAKAKAAAEAERAAEAAAEGKKKKKKEKKEKKKKQKTEEKDDADMFGEEGFLL